MAFRRWWKLQAITVLLAVGFAAYFMLQNFLFWSYSVQHSGFRWQHADLFRSSKETFWGSSLSELEDWRLLEDDSAAARLPSCTLPRFRNGSRTVDGGTRCHRKQPSAESCELAEEYFKDKNPPSCGPHHEICTLKFDDTKQYLHCHPDACLSGVVVLGTFQDGDLTWSPFSKAGDMEREFQHLVETRDPSVEGGIAFIHCQENEEDNDIDGEKDRNDIYSTSVSRDYSHFSDFIRERQLLIFPNITKVISPYHAPKGGESNVNVNLIFLDSISHSHFFRILPQSVEQLRRMDRGKNHHVFNFDRMQSLKGRTFENLQALLSGRFSDKVRVLSTEPMFAALKRRGYSTLYHQDLCWKWEWGLSRDFGFDKEKSSMQARWDLLRRKMSAALIDDIGATLTSCEVHHSNGDNDPFHADNTCYNGRQHSWYILEYAKQVQALYRRAGRPYFQFVELNIAHNDDGLRAKSLDGSLKEYLEYLSSVKNTLTMIFSDHGNTYTPYARTVPEGRIETYHPFLFILAPRDFARVVGRSGMEALARNQDKLMTHLDIHLMLRYLANDSSIPTDQRLSEYDFQPRGLLDPISPSRDCLSLPLFPNTLCTCVSRSRNTTHRSSQLLLADLGLGVLNNLIQAQFQSNSSKQRAFYSSCHKLVGTSIDDVKESIGRRNMTRVDMRVQVKPGHPFQSDEQFSFTFNISWEHRLLSFIGYERLSIYRKYEACNDPRVHPRICICDAKNVKSVDSNSTDPPDRYAKVFGLASSPQKLSPCLYMVERRRQAGMVLEAINQCGNATVEFHLHVVARHVAASAGLPARYVVGGGRSLFLVAFIAIGRTSNWDINYAVNITSEVYH